MKYFFDTEFYESGYQNPIRLISIGIVSEDNRTYYAVVDDIDLNDTSDWLKENVIPFLRDKPKPRSLIAKEIKEFLNVEQDRNLEFWSYFADYDWVVFCQIFGTMINMPGNMPHYCNDIVQVMRQTGIRKSQLPMHTGQLHNALDDAIWHKQIYNKMFELLTKN